MSSSALANQIVQVSTDAKARPTITAFTTMSAAMNMPHGDRSRGSLSAMSGELAAGTFAGVATAGGAAAGVDCAAGGGSAAGVVCAQIDAGRTRMAAAIATAMARCLRR